MKKSLTSSLSSIYLVFAAVAHFGSSRAEQSTQHHLNPFGDSKIDFLPFDALGNLLLRIPIGKVSSKEFNLPLDLQFSITGRSSSDLPAGWSVPLLNSYLILEDSNVASVMLPGGEQTRLRLSSDGQLSSYNEKITGVVKGNQVFLSSAHGEFVFEKGLIKKWTRGGNVIEWKYSESSVTEIYENSRRVAQCEIEGRGGGDYTSPH